MGAAARRLAVAEREFANAGGDAAGAFHGAMFRADEGEAAEAWNRLVKAERALEAAKNGAWGDDALSRVADAEQARDKAKAEAESAAHRLDDAKVKAAAARRRWEDAKASLDRVKEEPEVRALVARRRLAEADGAWRRAEVSHRVAEVRDRGWTHPAESDNNAARDAWERLLLVMAETVRAEEGLFTLWRTREAKGASEGAGPDSGDVQEVSTPDLLWFREASEALCRLADAWAACPQAGLLVEAYRSFPGELEMRRLVKDVDPTWGQLIQAAGRAAEAVRRCGDAMEAERFAGSGR